MAGAVGIEPTLEVLETSVLPLNYAPVMVEGGGFEPPNPKGTDLQSVAFSHFATPPNVYPNNIWWRMTGSNRRPPACRAGALPAELILLN